MKLRFLPAAEAELLREVAYYSEARACTGLRIHAAVQAAPERAANHPFGGAPSFKSARSILVRGFPFSVVYRASPGELLVIAIAPHRKRPHYWASRIE